jgi:NAD/NADP transhydrogenase beta subunit
MEFIRDYADWFYLIGAVLFILTLRGLSGPKTAIQGNRYGMIAMAIAVVTTFFVADHPVIWMIGGAMVLGAIVGIARARTVPMTQMPETVALMHSLVALGGFVLWLAWFGFNAASTVKADVSIGRIALNTHLAACASAVAYMVYTLICGKAILMRGTINASLGGLVAITAGCATREGVQ